jgi:hypothetical protein
MIRWRLKLLTARELHTSSYTPMYNIMPVYLQQ